MSVERIITEMTQRRNNIGSCKGIVSTTYVEGNDLLEVALVHNSYTRYGRPESYDFFRISLFPNAITPVPEDLIPFLSSAPQRDVMGQAYFPGHILDGDRVYIQHIDNELQSVGMNLRDEHIVLTQRDQDVTYDQNDIERIVRAYDAINACYQRFELL